MNWRTMTNAEKNRRSAAVAARRLEEYSPEAVAARREEAYRQRAEHEARCLAQERQPFGGSRRLPLSRMPV